MKNLLTLLKDLDQFCVGDYSQLEIKFPTDYTLEIINAFYLGIDGINDEFHKIFQEEIRSLDEIKEYYNYLDEIYEKTEILGHLTDYKPESINFFSAFPQFLQDTENLVKKISISLKGEGGENQELMYFSQKSLIQIYSFLQNYSKSVISNQNGTNNGVQNGNHAVSQWKELKSDFQEMIFAFQLVYHQLNFGQIYAETPLIFEAFKENLQKFLDRLRSFPSPSQLRDFHEILFQGKEILHHFILTNNGNKDVDISITGWKEEKSPLFPIFELIQYTNKWDSC